MANEQTTLANDRPKTGVGDFVTETRREIGKVTWPTRKEVTMTTTLIVVFAVIAGLFFLIVDSALGRLVSFVLGMNS